MTKSEFLKDMEKFYDTCEGKVPLPNFTDKLFQIQEYSKFLSEHVKKELNIDTKRIFYNFSITIQGKKDNLNFYIEDNYAEIESDDESFYEVRRFSDLGDTIKWIKSKI